MHPHSKKHPPGTHLLIYQTNSTFTVSTIINLKLVDIHGMSFPHMLYKLPPPLITFLYTRHFFFLCFFVSFSLHTFLWTCRILCEPRKYFSNSLFAHLLAYPITHSFLNGFQQTCVVFSSMYPLPTILFSACKNTIIYL